MFGGCRKVIERGAAQCRAPLGGAYLENHGSGLSLRTDCGTHLTLWVLVDLDVDLDLDLDVDPDYPVRHELSQA